MTEETQPTGSSAWLARLPRWQRLSLFAAFFVVVGLVLFGLTALLFIAGARSIAWTSSSAIAEDVTVAPVITFGSEDVAGDVRAPRAYPSSVAVDAAGTLYTGSYATGAVWSVDAQGTITTLPDTETRIGSIIGLDVAEDGALYILDRVDPAPETINGAIIWRYADNRLERVTEIPAEGDASVLLPNAIAVDSLERLYVVDLVQDRVLRILPDGSREVWWVSAENDLNAAAVAGIAYHAAQDTILIADTVANTLIAIPADADDPAAAALLRYAHPENEGTPGFNGVDVAPDGTLYVAALAFNRVARVEDETTLTYLAGGFRGSSDVAYDASTDRLFVSNWDQSSLVPQRFLFIQFEVMPRLPFTIDVIAFGASGAE